MHNGCQKLWTWVRERVRECENARIAPHTSTQHSTHHAQLDSSTLIVSPFQSWYSANVITTPKNHPANNSRTRVSTASVHAHTKQREIHESGRFRGGDSVRSIFHHAIVSLACGITAPNNK